MCFFYFNEYVQKLVKIFKVSANKIVICCRETETFIFID